MLFETNTIVGHRGCKIVDQNNTLEAFEKAIAVGAEMVEMDIRKTRDDVLVVFHDREIKGVRIRGNQYEDMAALANQEGLVLPVLEETLEKLENRMKIIVELKESGYEEKVMLALLKHFQPDEFVVTSFLDGVLLRIKKRFPTIKTGLILGVGGHNEEFRRRGVGRLVQKISEYLPWRRMKTCGADFLAVQYRLLRLGLLDSAFKRKIPVMVWTVNDPTMMRKLFLTRKVNGLITDRPDLAAEVRKKL